METDNKLGGHGKRQDKNEDSHASKVVEILQRYSRGEISDWDAADLLGGNSSIHDVFAQMRQYKIPLPEPTEAVMNKELAMLEHIFGKGKFHS
jgi:hypothetical protein